MKLLCLIFIILIIIISPAEAAIKNGYVEIRNARESLKSLMENVLSNTEMTTQQSRVMNDRILMLKNYIAGFELTENLLQEFRLIAPELYHEIDSIKDKNHISTDVYIKFIQSVNTDVQHPGATSIQYKESDHTSYSEYGANTVSIKIWIMDTSLTILAHELGHVKHEVPHLVSYQEYYKQNYQSLNERSNYLGHNPSDLSGRSAYAFEKQFSNNYKAYLRSSIVKWISPFKLHNEIRKNLAF